MDKPYLELKHAEWVALVEDVKAREAQMLEDLISFHNYSAAKGINHLPCSSID